MKKKLNPITLEKLELSVEQENFNDFSDIYNEYSVHINILNEFLVDTAYENFIELFHFLIQIPDINPAYNKNLALMHAANKNNLDILKILLNHPSVDPTDKSNSSIKFAYDNENHEIVDLLWKQESVKTTLKLHTTVRFFINGTYF